jgi:hypothetical protein
MTSPRFKLVPELRNHRGIRFHGRSKDSLQVLSIVLMNGYTADHERMATAMSA